MKIGELIALLGIFNFFALLVAAVQAVVGIEARIRSVGATARLTYKDRIKLKAAKLQLKNFFFFNQRRYI